MDQDIAWFELQLAIVRWHLDAAISAPTEQARLHIKKAEEGRLRACASLVHAAIDEQVRERLERECADLATRLGVADSSSI